jgi:hypothetical protein
VFPKVILRGKPTLGLKLNYVIPKGKSVVQSATVAFGILSQGLRPSER